MDKSEFLKAYLNSGNTLHIFEATSKNPQDYIGMLAPLAPTDLPKEIVSPVPKNDSSEAASYARENIGKAAASYKIKSTGEEVVRFAGGDHPQGVSFPKADWDSLIALYNQQKDQLGAEKPDMGDGAVAAAEEEAPTQINPDAPAAGQEEFLAPVAEEINARMVQAFEALNIPFDPVKVTAFSRQSLGTGARTKLREVARDFGEDLPAQATIDGANELTENVTRAMDISKKVKDGQTISEDDRDFVQKCFKFRGTGQNKGIWTKCGALADVAATDEEVYGLKIGTETSPIYEALSILEEKKADNGKPYISRGRGDTSESNAFNAIVNDIQEEMVNVAHIYHVEKNPKKAARELVKIVKDMGTRFNPALFTRVVSAKIGGDLDDLEVATFSEEGMNRYVNTLMKNIEDPDSRKVVAVMLAQSLQQFKNFVESFPDCKKFIKVGGITGRAGGKKVTADIQAECPGAETLDSLVVDSRYDVEGREDESGTTRLSVKQDSGGSRIYFGKYGLALARDLDSPDVMAVRQDHASLVEKIDSKGRSADEILRLANKAREREVLEVDNFIASVAAAEVGTIEDIARERLGSLSYDDSIRQRRFFDKLKEYNKTKDPEEKERMRKELTAVVTQAWRQSNIESPGVRENLALEILSTGGSSERQGFLLNSKGKSYVGLETDVIGPLYDTVINGGKVEFTETQMKIFDDVGPIGSLGLRVKSGEPIQELTAEKESAMLRLKVAEPAKQQKESLRAEDFVRQLQELIQGINEVSFI